MVWKIITNMVRRNNGGHVIPAGHQLVKYAGTWGPGWVWDGTKCIDPNPPPPPPPSAPPAPSPSPSIRTI
jgi:hypothetical protein